MFPGGEVKCILHIGEDEFEGNIKSFLEDRSMWEKNLRQFNFHCRGKKKKRKIRKQSTIKSLTPFQLF